MCRHRGTRLVTDAVGEFHGSIRCPYHSWTYSLSGDLVSAPFLDVDPENFHLHPVGVDTWGGFLFVYLEDVVEDLRTQLGALVGRTRNYPLSELDTGTSLTYDVAANWKVICENYNECYHCGSVHPGLCDVVPAFRAGGGSELDWERGIPHREGAWTFTRSGDSSRRPFPTLDADERERHKGELVYPNLLLSLAAEHVAAFTLWPISHDRTRIVCDFLFEPSAIADASFDPTDVTEFWDEVNRQDWAICERVQQGMSSRRFSAGWYAPMEDASLDIREYLRARGL